MNFDESLVKGVLCRVDTDKVKRTWRALMAMVLAAGLLMAGPNAPANAATLTSASFTASTPYTYAGASNARYDWGFTTATSSTLSQVRMNVPLGTDATGTKYLDLRNKGGYASTSSSVANSFTGDLDVRVKLIPTVSSLGLATLASKWNTGGNGGWWFGTQGGNLLDLGISTNGSDDTDYYSSPLSFTPNTSVWLRVTHSATSGSVTYFTSPDAITWTQFGSVITGAGPSMFASTAPVEVGAYAGAGTRLTNAKVIRAEVRNGIGGTIANQFDANEPTPLQAAAGTWASGSVNGETWTVTPVAGALPADIAADLITTTLSGLPAGGLAFYRFMEGTATYFLPTSTSVAAGTPVSISLQGFTTTATPGSYSSVITTYDNSGNPTAVDSATAGPLAFAVDALNTNASVTVDPSLTFSTGGHSGSCGADSQTAGVSASATSVTLGHLSALNSSVASQDVNVATNAATGFVLYARTSSPLNDGRGHSFPGLGVVGYGNAVPFPAAGTEAFGYRMFWWTAGTWATLPTYNSDDFMSSAGPSSGSATCILYRAQAGAATAAGSYSTTVIFTAVPRF